MIDIQAVFQSATSRSDIVNSLFPNLWMFIAHVIATVVLLTVLTFLVYKPFIRAMRARRKVISERIQDAVRKQIEATQNQQEANKRLLSAKQEATEIVLTAKNNATTQRQEILVKAKSEAAKIAADTEKIIQTERNDAKRDIKNQITNVAFDAAEAILKEKIDREQNSKLVNKFIDEI